MNNFNDPWLDPNPSPRIKELETLVTRQQTRLEQQEQIISLLLFQLSFQSETNPQTFDDETASFVQFTSEPIPENVIDLHEWLDRKYPF